MSLNYGEKWREITPEPLSHNDIIERIVVHPKTAEVYVLVRSFEDGMALRADLQSISNGDAAWETVMNGISIRSIALVPDDPQTIYLGTDDRPYYTYDGGAQWHIPEFEFPHPQIESMTVDPQEEGTVYAGTWQRAYKSIDAGKNWFPIHGGMAPDSDVFCLMFDKKGNLYAGTCGYVYISSNRGKIWEKLSKGLKGKRIHSLKIAPDGRILAGGDTGAYCLDESNSTWNELITGIVVYDMAVDDEGVIYCATESPGIIKLQENKEGYVALNDGLNATSPGRIVETAQGSLVVGLHHQHKKSGLWIRQNDHWTQLDFDMPEGSINDFLTMDNRLVLATNRGCFILESSQGLGRIHLLADKLVTSISKTGTGKTIAAGTLTGLYYIDLVDYSVLPIEEFNTKKINAVWMTSHFPGRVYVGCDDGLFFYSTELETWMKSDLKAENLKISEISGDLSQKKIFIASEDGLLMTEDQGITFSRQTMNLPDLPCRSVSMSNTHLFALFSDNTIYARKLDRFEWKKIEQGRDIPLWSLTASISGDTLYAGTHGYGVLCIKKSLWNSSK